MQFFIEIAWMVVKFLSYAGLAVSLGGVAVFGWHFVRLNAAAARTESSAIPAASWGGPGARKGLMILAAGIGIVILSLILSTLLGRF